jgi:hypothetical protein
LLCKGDASSQSLGCTTGCTSEAEHPNAGTFEALAAALLGLSSADRARLAAMLLDDHKGMPANNAP